MQQPLRLIIFVILGLLGFESQSLADGRVVLIPGAGASGPFSYPVKFKKSSDRKKHLYFARFQDDLAALGIESVVCPRTEDRDQRPLRERVNDCAEFLSSDAKPNSFTQRDLILVGHSMGGLIGRALAQDPRVRDRVLAVVTISTPHRGSLASDVAIDLTSPSSKNKLDIFAELIKLIGFTPDFRHYMPEIRTKRLGYDSSLFWAQDIEDNPEVRYFSFSTSMEDIKVLPLNFLQKKIEKEMVRLKLHQDPIFGVKSDGVVQEYSQVYGEYVGHIESHHFGSACGEYFKNSKSCLRTVTAVMPFLEGLAKPDVR